MFPASLNSNLCFAKVNTLSVMVAGSATPIDATAFGIAIIAENLRTAARALIYGDTACRSNEIKVKEVKHSLMFLSGSGLEMVIVGCNLWVDADELRHQFYKYCKNMMKWNHINSTWNLPPA